MANVFEREKQRVHDLALKCMEESMIIIEADTKQLCPVDTGNLKRSYTHEVDEKDKIIEGSVGTNVEYAYWVDLKQPHLTQAVDMNVTAIKEKFKNELSRNR